MVGDRLKVEARSKTYRSLYDVRLWSVKIKPTANRKISGRSVLGAGIEPARPLLATGF